MNDFHRFRHLSGGPCKCVFAIPIGRIGFNHNSKESNLDILAFTEIVANVDYQVELIHTHYSNEASNIFCACVSAELDSPEGEEMDEEKPCC